MNKTDIKCECGRTITIIIEPIERQIIASSPPTFPRIFSSDPAITPDKTPFRSTTSREGVVVLHPDDDVSEPQSRAIYAIATKRGIPVPEYSKWTKGQASNWIKQYGGNQ